MTCDWKLVEADLYEVKADAVDGAIIGLERLDGMFSGTGELSEHVSNTLNLLRIESENLRKRVEKIRPREKVH